MKFRDVHKINLVTVKLFSLQTLHCGTLQPTALERDVCPSVWYDPAYRRLSDWTRLYWALHS